jgi:hypothetical protein
MSPLDAAWGGTPAVLPCAVSLSAPEGKQGVEPRRVGHVVGHISGCKSAVTACGTQWPRSTLARGPAHAFNLWQQSSLTADKACYRCARGRWTTVVGVVGMAGIAWSYACMQPILCACSQSCVHAANPVCMQPILCACSQSNGQ